MGLAAGMIWVASAALGAGPPVEVAPPSSGKDPVMIPGSAIPVARPPTRLATSPVIRGLGPRLAARIRRDGLDARQYFLARGLSRAEIEREGGLVGGELGGILAGSLTGAAIYRLAPSAELIDAPQPMRPLLDVSRAAIGVETLDRGHDLPQKYRGRGALIATYDSGVDLLHPDLRAVDGPSRVVALWDQTTPGVPPAGHTGGTECTRAMLAADECAAIDPAGHGTHVLSIAAGNGPHYRGMAPDAAMIVARSDDFQLFFESLVWFQEVATAFQQPMVVNLSIGGHEGPHDGTSLESQAIDAYPHLVVAASGNEGTLAVHARAPLSEGEVRDVVLRFPDYPQPIDQTAVIDVWGPIGRPLAISVAILRADGEVLAETSSAAIGAPGRTERLAIGPVEVGRAQIDPEATANAFNGQSHVRVEVFLESWQDAPAGPGFASIRVRGDGQMDLWVDTPATQDAPVSFDRDGVVASDTAVLGDTEFSVSDPATAVSAIAVSAYTTRTVFPTPRGQVSTIGGAVGSIAKFSSYGPTRAPEKTGPKPDLAAPGFVIVGARSRDAALEDTGLVSPLYRASAGTSMAAPHVAGVAALILGVKPAATKFDLKQYLIGSAAKDGEVTSSNDARWGAGRLDAWGAVSAGLGLEQSCSCTAAREHPHGSLWGLAILALLAWAARLDRRIPRVLPHKRCTPGIAIRAGHVSSTRRAIPKR